MAQIKEELVIIKISRLVKDGMSAETAITSTITDTVESVVQELVGVDVLVEIVKEED